MTASPPSGCPTWCDRRRGDGHIIHTRSVDRFPAGDFETEVVLARNSGRTAICVCAPVGRDGEAIVELSPADARSLAAILLAEDPGPPLGEALVKAAVLATAREGAE